MVVTISLHGLPGKVLSNNVKKSELKAKLLGPKPK